MAKFLTLAVLALLMSGCDRRDEAAVLTLAHSLDEQHVVHKAMLHMDSRLREISGGEMRLRIYAGGQLGGERELIELLQIGSLAMTKVSASPLESFVPAMKVFSVPYVFRDRAHLFTALDGPIGKQLLLSPASAKLRGLGYFDAGSRSFYSNERPIHRPDDLKGLKIRVQKSQTSVQMVETLGGAATPIAWGELYTALQQGVVDGAENNPPSFYRSRHYEVSRFYTLDEHTAVPDILLIGLPVWDNLNEQQQRWLQQAADEAVALQRQLWAVESDAALAAVAADGVTIIRPDKRLFIERASSMHQTYRGSEVGELIEQIAAIDTEGESR